VPQVYAALASARTVQRRRSAACPTSWPTMPPTAAPPTVAAVLPRPTAFPATPPIAAPPTVPSVSFVVPHPATAANAKAKATTYLVIASSGSNTQNAYGNSHARSAVHSTARRARAWGTRGGLPLPIRTSGNETRGTCRTDSLSASARPRDVVTERQRRVQCSLPAAVLSVSVNLCTTNCRRGS